MRVIHRSVLLLLFYATACGGGDLALPGPGGDPSRLSIVSGDGQQGTVGEIVAEPLVVELLDGSGRPVPGATVAFRFSDNPPDALVDPAGPATDTLGHASATARLGSVAGVQPIDAQVALPGQDLLVRFRLTAVERPRDDGGGGGGGGSAEPPPQSGGEDPPGDGGGGAGGGGGSGGGGGHGSNDDSGGGHGHHHDQGHGNEDD
jgi:hypothetical protein